MHPSEFYAQKKALRLSREFFPVKTPFEPGWLPWELRTVSHRLAFPSGVIERVDPVTNIRLAKDAESRGVRRVGSGGAAKSFLAQSKAFRGSLKRTVPYSSGGQGELGRNRMRNTKMSYLFSQDQFAGIPCEVFRRLHSTFFALAQKWDENY